MASACFKYSLYKDVHVVQSVALEASFYYGGFFQFQYQLLILLVTATVAVVCLFPLEWRVTRHTGLVESAYRPIGQSN